MSAIFWKKGISANWTAASDWSTGKVPGPADVAILGALGTYTVTSSADATVDMLTTAAGATLDIAGGTFWALAGTGPGATAGKIEVADGASFEVGGLVRNAGIIGLNSTGDPTKLIINKAVTITGSGLVFNTGGGTLTPVNGDIALSDSQGNEILGDSVNGGVLTLEGAVILGAGQIGNNGDGKLSLHIERNGGVFATGANPFTIDTGNTIINSGGALGVTGGNLNIADSIDNTGGKIGIRFGGTLEIGTLALGTTLTGGSVANNAGMMEIDVSDMNNVAVETDAFGLTSITATTIEATKVYVLTLLATGFHSEIDVEGEGFDQVTPGTFTGGVVEANQGGQLRISDYVLKGVTFEAVVGTPSQFANYGGGGISLEGCIVEGGTLTTASTTAFVTDGTQSGGIFVDGTTFDGNASAIVNKAQVGVGEALTLTGTIKNIGTIYVESQPVLPLPFPVPFPTGPLPSTLYIDNAATLTGNGTITLQSYGTYANITGDPNDGGTLTNEGNTIVGLGQIIGSGFGSLELGYISNTLTLRNLAGTIDAAGDPQSITNALTIETGNVVINQALMEATGGGVLAIYDSVNNAGEGVSGRINATGAGSAIDLVGGNIAGGTVTIGAGALLEATGGALSPSTLQHVIVTDTGALEATNSTTLTLTGTTVNAAGGVVEAVDAGTSGPPAASAIVLDGSTINGGTLETAAGGMIETLGGSDSTLNGVTIHEGTTVTVVDDSTLTIKGTIANDGVMVLQSTGDQTELVLGGNVTLTGPGAVALDDATPGPQNAIVAAGASKAHPFTLTNVSNRIEGAGVIGHQGDGTLKLSNQAGGTINADGADSLTINTGNTVANAGLMESTGSGGLLITDAVANAGTIQANGGNVAVEGALTGAGKVDIFSACNVTLGSSASNGVIFENDSGNSGSLILDSAQGFIGTVAGFALGDSIDLENFQFSGNPKIAKVTGTGAAGTTTNVTITDGTQSVVLKLVNDVAGEFAVSAGAYSLTADSHSPIVGTLFELASVHA
jgi:hypothetical protein